MGLTLDIRDLSVRFPVYSSEIEVVRNCSLSVDQGEILGLVGESGSGKSMTAMSCLGLVPKPGSSHGSLRINGNEIIGASDGELNRLRGAEVGMIFQNPMSALNPFISIGEQISDAVSAGSRPAQRKVDRQFLVETLESVLIPDPEGALEKYPHEFSGGQLQRIMIAMVIACEPQLLIADEPTTALDVTIQAQVLLLLRRLAREKNLAVLFITHDLSVVATICDRVSVMYAGEIVESGTVEAVFAEPSHPYTRKLLGTVPAFGRDKARLEFIPGQVPDMGNLPHGCAFQARCANAVEICGNRTPPVIEVAEGHYARCHLAATNQVRQP